MSLLTVWGGACSSLIAALGWGMRAWIQRWVLVGEVRGVRYVLTPNGGAVTVGDVFHVAMSVLVGSAGMGVERRFERIGDDGLGFRFAAVLDGDGVSVMTEAELMRTVVYVARKMVGEGSFREVGIRVWMDGRKVGEGQWSNPLKTVSQQF